MSGKEQRPPGQEADGARHERLPQRLSDGQLISVLADDHTTVHMIELATNSFGEFLFVTLSWPAGTGRRYVTFWGAGYHEYRERWITNDWQWYDSARQPEGQGMAKAEALDRLQKRADDIAGWDRREAPSSRARLFEMLADLTDEDGALTELDDLNDLLDP